VTWLVVVELAVSVELAIEVTVWVVVELAVSVELAVEVTVWVVVLLLMVSMVLAVPVWVTAFRVAFLVLVGEVELLLPQAARGKKSKRNACMVLSFI